MRVLTGWAVAAGLVLAAVPAGAQVPPATPIRGVPRPPGLIPFVESRSVPMPRAAPRRPEAPAAVQPAEAKAGTEAGTAPQITGTIGESRPAPPPVQPTQAMPPVQGLE